VEGEGRRVRRGRSIAAVLVAWGCLAGTAAARDQEAREFAREAHGDWTIRCAAATPDDCYMMQLGVDDAGNPVVEVSLIRFPTGQAAAAGLTVIAPLGTALPEGAILQVDGGPRVGVPYDFCTQAGCIANLALTEADVQAYKRGLAATVSVAPAQAPDRPVTIRLSLAGFTAAYDALTP
jgi:invasion protein IalB